MREQLYEQLCNNPGLSRLKSDLTDYTCKNLKLLYSESTILSVEFVINPYITIEYDQDKEHSILYPVFDFYDNLTIQSELITPYDSVLLLIKDCKSKITGHDILDAICEDDKTLLLEENLNFLLRKYFSCLFITKH